MEIAIAIILVVLGIAVGVPLVTMAATDFKHALPPAKDLQEALPPGEGDVQYEVYDEATGSYSIVTELVADDSRKAVSPNLIKIPAPSDGNIVRIAKRDLALVTSSASPVATRKEKLNAQVIAFEKCSGALDISLKRAFTETSLTYDVHASAVDTATSRFWKNVYVGCEILQHFDANAYHKLENDLARSERMKFDSFDSGVLARQIREAAEEGELGELTDKELAKIKAKTDEAEELARDGKQLQARELLSQAKAIAVEKSRETSPAYIKMQEMDQSLSEADELIRQNDEIIGELEHLSSELRVASVSNSTSETEDVVAELSRLSGNLNKYEFR